MKILVTGGSGFLGTHIKKFFDADDFSRRAGLDILNMQDAQRVKDYDVVIHLAALLDKSPDATEMTYLTNVDGTINLLRSMNENAVFIFASTKDVYGRFADNYPEVPEQCPTVYAGQSALEWSKLIAERYERVATIITSNLDLSEWSEAFPANNMLGAATLDRLRHGAYRVVLDGASYRTPRPTTEASKSAVAKTPKNP